MFSLFQQLQQDVDVQPLLLELLRPPGPQDPIFPYSYTSPMFETPIVWEAYGNGGPIIGPYNFHG